MFTVWDQTFPRNGAPNLVPVNVKLLKWGGTTTSMQVRRVPTINERLQNFFFLSQLLLSLRLNFKRRSRCVIYFTLTPRAVTGRTYFRA